MKHYTDPDSLKSNITTEELKTLSHSQKIEVMKTWFYKRYEDPANSMPYCSEEGYLYLNGGPFDAHEVLEDEFHKILSEEIIQEAVDEITSGGFFYWTRTDSYDNELYPCDYDEYDAALKNDDPHNTLEGSLDHLSALIEESKFQDDLQDSLIKMIYCFCITAMETYLADIIIKKIDSDIEMKKRYIKASRDFKKGLAFKKLYELNEQKIKEQIENTVKESLLKTSFHNLKTVEKLYKDVLCLEVPKAQVLEELISKRHHFIHRNGKDEDGKPVCTSKEEVIKLIDNVRKFCSEIDMRLLGQAF
jgi:hypothetical protein